MWTTRPTAGTVFTDMKIIYQPLEMFRSRLGFFDDGDITNPFIPSQWRERVPYFSHLNFCIEESLQILGHSMYRV